MPIKDLATTLKWGQLHTVIFKPKAFFSYHGHWAFHLRGDKCVLQNWHLKELSASGPQFENKDDSGFIKSDRI